MKNKQARNLQILLKVTKQEKQKIVQLLSKYKEAVIKELAELLDVKGDNKEQLINKISECYGI